MKERENMWDEIESFLKNSSESLPKDGFWKYYKAEDCYWDLTEALFDRFPELCEEYDEDDRKNLIRIPEEILDDAYESSPEKALSYYDWLFENFPFDEAEQTKDKDEAMAADSLLILAICNFLNAAEREDNGGILYNYLRNNKKLFERTFIKRKWSCREGHFLSDYLRFFEREKDYAQMREIYSAYLTYQKEGYTQETLGEFWTDYLFFPEGVMDDELYDFIKDAVNALGADGEEAKRELSEITPKSKVKEEPLRDKYGVLECCKDAEKKEYVIHSLHKTLAEINKNEKYSEGYDKNVKELEFCYESTSKMYDAVCYHTLLKYGGVKEIGEALFLGKIPSDKIDEIYMLAIGARAMDKFSEVRYRDMDTKTEYTQDGKKRTFCVDFTDDQLTGFVINAKAMAHLEKYHNYAKIKFLLDYAECLFFDDGNTALTTASKVWDSNMKAIVNDIRSVFGKLAVEGKVKSKYGVEKGLYDIAKNVYADAVFKYGAPWLGKLVMDIYIPSLNVAVEYKPSMEPDDYDSKYTIQQIRENSERFYEKRKLCRANGVTFAEWGTNEPISEESFKEKIQRL